MTIEVANTVNEVAETVAATAVPAQKAVNTATRLFFKGASKVKRFSPQILLGAGIIGVVGAGYLACKATLRLEEVVSKAEQDIEEVKELRTNEAYDTDVEYNKALAKVYFNRSFQIVKLYTPALSVATVSIGCLLGAHGVMNRRNMATIAAYQSLSSGFERFRQNVAAELGEEKAKQLEFGIVEKELPTFDEEGNQTGTKTVLDVDMGHGHSGYARIFDESNDNWSKVPGMNQLFITNQQNWLNDRLNARGHLFLNDVYKALGLPPTTAGQVVGWLRSDHPESKDGRVDFGLMEIENEAKRDFVNAYERSVILDFNVDGVMYDKI